MGKTPVRGVHEGRRDASHTVIFVGRAERPGPVRARTDVGREGTPATVTDRTVARPSRRVVAAGKQRRGRAKCPAHSIPADDASFPCIISIRFQSFLNFVLEAENLDLENQNIFFKDYCRFHLVCPPHGGLKRSGSERSGNGFPES